MLVTEIARYLDELGLVKYDETGTTGNVFIMTLPPTPDTAVSIYPTGGGDPDNKNGYDTPTVQLLVRGNVDPRPAHILAHSIYDKLNGFRHGTLTPDGVWVLFCRGVQSAPVYIGKDDNGRHEYSLNFMLETKRR